MSPPSQIRIACECDMAPALDLRRVRAAPACHHHTIHRRVASLEEVRDHMGILADRIGVTRGGPDFLARVAAIDFRDGRPRW
jgi:hypothetical protein